MPGEGECRPECATNRDCPLRSVCVESLGRRVCQPGCATDRDCGPDEICGENGSCVSEALVCKFTAQCPPCSFCESGSCRPSTAPTCAPCEEDSECGEGGVCWEGKCAPACKGGCPSGFGCQKLPTGEAGTRDVCLPLDGICDTECT